MKKATVVVDELPRPRGKHTFYPGKVTTPVTSTITQEAHDVFSEFETGTEASRADLIEHAVRLMGGRSVNPTLHALVEQTQAAAKKRR